MYKYDEVKDDDKSVCVCVCVCGKSCYLCMKVTTQKTLKVY